MLDHQTGLTVTNYPLSCGCTLQSNDVVTICPGYLKCKHGRLLTAPYNYPRPVQYD